MEESNEHEMGAIMSNVLPRRVQGPNNHILTQNLYYIYYYPKPKHLNYYCPKPKYLIIRYMDPKP